MLLNKTEAQKLVIDLLKSLNQGNTGYPDERPYVAIQQYLELRKLGIIKENREEGEDPFF